MPYAPQRSQSAHPDWNTAQGMSQYYPSFLLENQSNYEAFRRDISWLGAFCDDIIRDLTAKGYTCRLDDSNLASSSSSLTQQTHWTSPSTSPPSLFENLQPSPTSSRSQYGHSPHDNASFASPAADISEEYNIRPFLSRSSHASSTYNDSHSQSTRGACLLAQSTQQISNFQSTLRHGSEFNGIARPRGPSPPRRAAQSVPPPASSSSAVTSHPISEVPLLEPYWVLRLLTYKDMRNQSSGFAGEIFYDMVYVAVTPEPDPSWINDLADLTGQESQLITKWFKNRQKRRLSLRNSECMRLSNSTSIRTGAKHFLSSGTFLQCIRSHLRDLMGKIHSDPDDVY
ncbi:hypothetical protein CPB85DRAFT_1439973 [Mucidula mucida]|nr:hypothetical protein CPB85DRAFT_1439973 [Mucidula mucida]